MGATYPENIDRTVADPNLQLAIYSATGRLVNHRRATVTPDVLPEYQELRTLANRLKKHTIENLDYYLETVEASVERNGGKVIFCRDADEVSDFILGLAKERGAHLIVKSKSMTTQEGPLNDRLEQNEPPRAQTAPGGDN